MTDVEKNETAQSIHVADAGIGQSAESPTATNKSIVQGAADRAEFDHNLLVKDAVRYYRWAIFWCLALSMTVVCAARLDHIGLF